MKTRKHTIGGLALPALLLTSLLLLAVTPASARPSTDDEGDIAALPPDADNVEFHHIKVVDGVMHEDHPVVMYKEDFVSEDYDPSKNETKVSSHKKHKHSQHIRHHRNRPGVEKQQKKILFDVLPESPIVMADDDDDSGADNFVAAPLVQPAKEKQLLKRRQRRQAHHQEQRQHDKLHKRSYSYLPPDSNYLFNPPYQQFHRQPVRQKPPTFSGPLPQWQRPSRPVQEPSGIPNRDSFTPDFNDLVHNTNPEDADFSVFDRPQGAEGVVQQTDRPEFAAVPTRRPAAARPPPATEAPPRRPSNSWSPQRTTTTRAPNRRVSPCVWAIVNCCEADSEEIRYNCFEHFGCIGAFWDINPCADSRPANALAAPRAPSRVEFVSPAIESIFFTTGGLVFPSAPSFQLGSTCQRASLMCCKLANLGSLYDCFQHQKCEHSFAEILEMCS
ncbi:hypothetical protein KR222_011115 [Zaprionus bogoriensis]|nr:hypothetical protein KR222_011115 [Zaprionus bogoriensis]